MDVRPLLADSGVSACETRTEGQQHRSSLGVLDYPVAQNSVFRIVYMLFHSVPISGIRKGHNKDY